MTNKFAYCSVAEMAEDQKDVGIGDDVLRRFIIPASQYMLQEIGQFFPLIQTIKMTGSGKKVLFVAPLLRVNGSIVNDGTTLVTADYILRADEKTNAPAWLDGPYLRLEADPDSVNLSVWSEEENAISLPCVWGLYEKAEATGATIATTQTIGATTLAVNDGSKISLGMMLEIESEWEFVKEYSTPTAAVTTLSAALDASSEIVSLTNGTLVKVGEIIKTDFEQMKVLDIQGNSGYVARGWNNTKKVAHLISAAVAVYRTFTVERAINGSSAAEHVASTAVERLMVPEDVNYLCRQIATLMMKKSQTGYAGRSGSSETGEQFYNFEFPRDAIARIKANYEIPAAR